MNATPTATSAIGSRNRASPKNQPTNVSSALPSGPPRSKYIASASTDADPDQHDAGEVVLLAGDRAAQLGGRRVAPAGARAA